MEDDGYSSPPKQPGKEPGAEISAAAGDSLGAAGKDRVAATAAYRPAIRHGAHEPGAGILPDEAEGYETGKGGFRMVQGRPRCPLYPQIHPHRHRPSEKMGCRPRLYGGTGESHRTDSA